MPNREHLQRGLGCDSKLLMATTQSSAVAKASPLAVKATVCKSAPKEAAMSPTPASAETERTELLGSLTTQQQQRTSARVIKKLKLEPPADKKVKRPDGQSDDPTECETPNKIDDKDPLKFPTVKQRMPKALWSTDEKSLFFEALNEYGKDFDAITAHICAKMKKKGMPDINLKTKTQVSHFYYRTWHKLSKHVHFDENVKKVAQELYALINYGELRKKLASVSEKTCARLGEMVRGGSMVVRARGRNMRVRTPACRALRKLNQITEPVVTAVEKPTEDIKEEEQGQDVKIPCVEDKIDKEEDKEELEGHLQLETDRIIVNEQKQSKKLALHVGPRPTAVIHLPVLTPSEQLSSQKICFSSYLERMCSQIRDQDVGSKIRNTKRQRKDSATDKDKEVEPKKVKSEEVDSKLMNIDETAIDGIELMANYKCVQEEEEKPSTEDEKEMKIDDIADEEADREVQDNVIEKEKEVSERREDKDITERDKDISERDKDMSEREKDSFSEMEDDEKYNKSDTDNESDHGKNEKSGKQRKFKNLKVKFRIRPKKRGGSIYTLVLEKEPEEKNEEQKVEDEPKSDIDVELAIRQIKKGWSASDAGDLTIGDLYLMFGSRSKLELDYWWAEPTPPLPQPPAMKSNKQEAQIDKDKCTESRKVEKTPDKAIESATDDGERARESDTDIFSPKNAYSQDSNDGMSGDERKSEQIASPDHKSSSSSGVLKLVSKLVNRPTASPPSPTSVHQNGLCQMRERLKRLLVLVGNTNVTNASTSPTGRCVCGHVCTQKKTQVPIPKQQAYEETVVVQAPTAAMFRRPTPVALRPELQPKQQLYEEPSQVLPQPVGGFRHPTPIAPRPDPLVYQPMSLEGIPRWRRGRPRLADQRVVVQRLLPLLPKLPPPSNLIPVKIVPNSPPVPPKILPKPPPANTTAGIPCFYMISELNGQFFFHDGDRKIPITSAHDNGENTDQQTDENREEEVETNGETDAHPDTESKPDIGPVVVVDSRGNVKLSSAADSNTDNQKTEAQDIGNFLPSESISLSPSRLLRETEGWFEGSVQDFSLSSFLGHLEGRPQPDLAVDSQLQSLITESSVDYVAKFADLAAEVTDEVRLDDELK